MRDTPIPVAFHIVGDDVYRVRARTKRRCCIIGTPDLGVAVLITIPVAFHIVGDDVYRVRARTKRRCCIIGTPDLGVAVLITCGF
jgi:hypothetical protein